MEMSLSRYIFNTNTDLLSFVSIGAQHVYYLYLRNNISFRKLIGLIFEPVFKPVDIIVTGLKIRLIQESFK